MTENCRNCKENKNTFENKMKQTGEKQKWKEKKTTRKDGKNENENPPLKTHPKKHAALLDCMALEWAPKTKDKCPKQSDCVDWVSLTRSHHHRTHWHGSANQTDRTRLWPLLQMAVQFDSTSDDHTPKWCFNNNNNAILKHNTNYNHVEPVALALSLSLPIQFNFNPIANALTTHYDYKYTQAQ